MQVATREQGGKVSLSLCSSLGVVSELLGSACEHYLPFLGVFQL